jgi:hypothetical protein
MAESDMNLDTRFTTYWDAYGTLPEQVARIAGIPEIALQKWMSGGKQLRADYRLKLHTYLELRGY